MRTESTAVAANSITGRARDVGRLIWLEGRVNTALVSMQPVFPWSTQHGTNAGHVAAGADQYMAFYIVIRPLGIAVGGIARGFADFPHEIMQAERQFLVIASQATILRGLACESVAGQ
jgi:hypothetical protein